MTTRKFSAISLPYPKYSLEIGCFNLEGKDLDLAKYIPKFNNLTHVIEVKKTGSALMTKASSSAAAIAQYLTGSYLVLENFRPELFLRRDFISKFVNTGTIYFGQNDSIGKDLDYEIQTSTRNRMLIKMNERQYRRFGMIAKKVVSNKSTGCKYYRIEIDLKDERIMKSNKYQDKMVETLKRLKPSDKIYFKYKSTSDVGSSLGTTQEEADDNKCLDYFKYIIDEYEKDGFKPVPLTNCYKLERKIVKSWTNYSQLHPNLNLNTTNISEGDNHEHILEIVDWLGYQVLSLDYENIQSDRLDIKCTEISGCAFDFDQNIGKYFENLDKLSVFRALIMYNKQENSTNKGVIFLQETCSGKSNLIIKVDLI